MKCYIIRLEENDHSVKMAYDCAIQAIKHGIKPNYFKAINGNDAEYHYEKTGLKRRKKFKKNRLGVVGCFFSHYYLWKKCVEKNESFLILEHDGYLIRNIPDNIHSQFSDVLKLDRLDPYKKTYNTDIENEKNNPLVIEEYYNKSAKNPVKIGTGNYMKGAYSYIIKPHAAQKLIDWVHEFGFMPADQQIGNAIVDIKVTTPTVARLHPWYSIGSNINTGSLTQNLEVPPDV